MDIMKRVFECGIVPVIKIDDANDAIPLCKALSYGGIDVVEITFRTDAAEEAIKKVSSEMNDVVVGAGTVLNVDTAKKAVAAGAKFIVTPGMNLPVLEYCVSNNIPIMPGCSGPTDFETALYNGVKTVKFFPAETMGGLKALKAMSAPYSMLKFMPTGGINAENLGEYMNFDKIIACGGTWMANEKLIKEKKFDKITELSKEAVLNVHGFTFKHMGINTENSDEAGSVAEKFNKAFGFTKRDIPVSVFTGNEFIEIMKAMGKGDCGHIGIKSNNVARAIAYLHKNGIETDISTLRGTEEKPTFIYLKDSFGPFAVHIMN